MAQRDKSQGFGFVYVNIKKLLEERDELLAKESFSPDHSAQVVNLNRDPKPVPQPAVLSKTDAPKDAVHDRTQAINQIRTNLDRLQALHHRLHSMLEELNAANDRKKSN